MTDISTFNMLSHGYTKFNGAHHGQPGVKAVESPEQRRHRLDKNASLLLTVRPDILLTQEHDQDVELTGYTRVVSAFVDGRTEGCSVLLRAGAEFAASTAGTVDLGDGKSAALALLRGFGAKEGLSFLCISAHLKGGPGSEASRRAQVERLFRSGRVPDAPCVVFAGDFNDTDPDATFGDVLRAAGLVRVPGVGPTGLDGSMRVPLMLDHFYVRGVTLRDPVALPATLPGVPWLPVTETLSGSDHVPVSISLSLSPSTPSSPLV